MRGPRGPTRPEDWLRAADGTPLHLRSWGPEERPAAVLGVVHGVGEHAGRYAEFARLLARLGIAVRAFDHRGHGRSGGPPAHVDRWERYLDDLERFLARAAGGGDGDPPVGGAIGRTIEGATGGAPTFLFGHSMGSLIVLERAAWTRRGVPSGVAGVITSGVALDPHGIARPWKIAAAKLLSRLLPRFRLDLGIAPEDLSRDPDVVRAYRDDPLVRRRATVRWGAEALGAIERVRESAPSIRLPLLALHGECDPIAPAEGSRWLAAAVGSEDVRLEVLPGALHEPHNDLCRERVAERVAGWLKDRALRSASAPRR